MKNQKIENKLTGYRYAETEPIAECRIALKNLQQAMSNFNDCWENLRGEENSPEQLFFNSLNDTYDIGPFANTDHDNYTSLVYRMVDWIDAADKTFIRNILKVTGGNNERKN